MSCNTTVSAFKERTKYQNQNETYSDLRIYNEHKQLKAFNNDTDNKKAYALTNSGIDLVVRGMMRSLS